MSRFGWPSLLALAAIGCVTDNELTSKDDPSTQFDSGGDWQPPEDTDDTDIDTDSGGGTVMPDYCDERSFAAEAVAQDADCEGGPRQPDWNLEVLWEKQVGSGTYSPPVVGQVTDDNSDGVVDDSDVPDIVVFDASAVLWVISAEDGSNGWQATLSNSMNQLSAIGDVDGDGLPNVVADSNYTVTAYDNEGRVVWTGPSSYGKNKGTCGAFGMADLDGDGSAEVYHGSRIIDGTNGDVRGNGSEGDGLGVGNSYGHSIAADLDGDGVWEVVVGNAAYDPDGNSVWANGEPDGTVAVADLDRDGSPEVVSVGNYGVYTMDANGNVLWTFDLGGGLATTPAIADIDGDTYPEALVATTSELFVLDMNGNEVMSISAPGSGSGRGGVSAYDFDGNGTWEIVWQAPTALLIIDGKTGDTLTDYSLTAPTCAGPVPIVDADNDGDADIITYDSSGKIRVLTDSAGFTQARPVWHQSDYSLTNIGDNSEMPEDPEPNWMGANNFRAGAPVEQINSLYPVIRDVCADECEGGSVWVWYSVANNGYYSVNDRLAVEFWGVTDAGYALLGEATWSGTVDAGMMTEADFIQLTGVSTPLYDIDVRISGTSEDYTDCDDADDIDKWGSQICE
ncbi:MAG: hypothetical protein FJ102_18120 [Deltaproteobacteria bacterium]|nr:hypothetical protein [Deltaproteobacteria bacterium]